MQLQKAKESDSPTMKIEPKIQDKEDGYPQPIFGHASLRSIYLIETEDALALINEKPDDLRIVNAQWYIPGMGDAVAEHLAVRLTESTQHIHLPEISDATNPVPQMLCSLEQWTEKMRKHHIRRTDNILLYDTNGFFSVARVALMFRYFGANRVRIINGGLKKWKLEGKPVFEGDYVPGEGLDAEGDYNYHVVDEGIFVRDIDTVHKAARQVFVGDKSVQILDARPHVLTYGGTPGRPGFLSGHITGSKNLFA